ncbi:MAG TPA: penicillin-binding protein 2, partial [Terriglobales bacterium]|nr:penicillin-binding protein 2 [Terriglobales bacterium]
ERQYNDWLMGKNGSRNAIVNSRGKEVGMLSQTPAVPGKPLKLTIDLDLQIAAEEALEGKNGAIVAMDPRNGEVLAMVSRPTYDPNAFAVRITRKEWNDLVTDPAKPLMNKAIQAQLAPGSTFKIIMATAGMQEGIAQDMRVNCPGGGTFYGRYFKCWIAGHGNHGTVDISKAIYQSCDTFFYTLGERLGIGRIAKYATAFGLGQKTKIDLPQEVSGVMPSEEWKIKNFKQKWYAGETISVAIGQGAVATTPVQMMRAIGAIASGGMLRRPHVAFPDQLPENMRYASDQPNTVAIPIDPKNWEVITDAMSAVVNPGGTAALSHIDGVDFGGKTGSAQTISNAAKARLSGDKSKYKDNGWFVGVTPRRNPELVVSVLVEGGEHGSLSAQLASKVVKAFVEKQKKRDVRYAERFRPGTPENESAISQAPSTTPVLLTPSKAELKDGSIVMAGVGSIPDADAEDNERLIGGHFRIKAGKARAPVAIAAPGLH